MRAGAIIQARMTSNRLPGKVLCDIEGKPALQYLVESLARCPELHAVVVATSIEQADDPIIEFCEQRNLSCHRGPLNDVAQRVVQVLDHYPLDCFFRVCGDSPLLDHRLLSDALSLYRQGEYDLVTNVMPRTFPAGQSVELVRTTSLRQACGENMDDEDREHVTRYFYRLAQRYRIGNFAAPHAWREIRLSLDTAEDLATIRAIASRMKKPHWQYTVGEIVDLHARVARN